MSKTITLHLDVEIDGRLLESYPVSASVAVPAFHAFRLPQAPETLVYEPLPTETLTAGLFLMLRPEGTVKLRLGTQTTSNIPLNDRGCLLVFGGATDMSKVVQIRDDADTRVNGVCGG